MLKSITSLVACSIIMAGCSSAKKANEVSAAYVPMSRYSSMTCEQLVNEAESIRRTTPALESAVDKHRSQQTGVEVVTWLLFFPAALALDKGEKETNELAQARGEIQAVQQALTTHNCGNQTTAGVTHSDQVAPVKISNNSESLDENLIALKHRYDSGLISNDIYLEQQRKLLEANVESTKEISN